MSYTKRKLKAEDRVAILTKRDFLAIIKRRLISEAMKSLATFKDATREELIYELKHW